MRASKNLDVFYIIKSVYWLSKEFHFPFKNSWVFLLTEITVQGILNHGATSLNCEEYMYVGVKVWKVA